MTHKTGGTNLAKDVIYIDVDDEITAIIEKIHSSEKKIVALVLPKRAAVLQSIVNMKLLKRSATDSKKNLVLITAETGLLPLAASVGIHVAKSLSSKPEIPPLPEHMTAKKGEDTIDAELDDEPLDGGKTVGELSGDTPAIHVDDDPDETIELDDEDPIDAADNAKGDKPAKKDRRFKIPNFNKFRVSLVLAAIGVLLLSTLGYAAVAVWPKAVITIKTDSTAVDVSAVLNLKTAADAKLDTEETIVPAQIQEVKKTLEQEVPATGQRNDGEKASGSVTMEAEACAPNLGTPNDVPSGTGISTGGLTFIIQHKAKFNFDHFSSGSCAIYKTNAIDITAQSGGAKYNVTDATFTVAGRSKTSATGSATGGTDKIVKVVTNADIDGAKQKITEQDRAPIIQELKSALVGRGLFPLEVTLSIGDPETKLSAEANDEAESVKVTQIITYGMLGVMQEDLEKVVGALAEKEIDTKKQAISSYGIDNALFSLQGLEDDGATVSMQATAVAGAELDADIIRKQVAGLKAGDAKDIISVNPGVTDVQVTYSPFWVSSIPKNTSKITVTIEEPRAISEHAESP